MTVYLEQTIMQKGLPATAGSKLLADFIAPFSATVAERLLAKGHTIAGRVNCPEFGIFGIVEFSKNSIILDEAIEKAQAGAAVLCNDLFGVYARAAASNGLAYIRPTYGTVSRYGLIPAACSMDQVGILCKDPEEGFDLLADIAGNDDQDGAMFPEEKFNYTAAEKAVKVLDFNETPPPYFELYSHVMYILTCGEISNNINRYDGVKFGWRPEKFSGLEDLYQQTRAAFALDTKLTAIMGAMVLSEKYYERYYDKALKCRRLIKEALFKDYDVLVLPAEIDGDAYQQLALYALAPLAGLPSVSFGGKQIIANVKGEPLLKTVGFHPTPQSLF